MSSVQQQTGPAIFEEGGFRATMQPLDLGLARPRVRGVLDVWLDQRAAAAMPAPDCARFDAFTFAIGRLHLIEVRADGHYFFRIFGSMGSRHLDFHRRETVEIRPAAFRSLIECGIAEVVAGGAPLLHDIAVEIPRRRCSYQRLLLPYGPPAGPAELLLVCTDEENEKDAAEVFRDPMFEIPVGTAATIAKSS